MHGHHVPGGAHRHVFSRRRNKWLMARETEDVHRGELTDVSAMGQARLRPRIGTKTATRACAALDATGVSRCGTLEGLFAQWLRSRREDSELGPPRGRSPRLGARPRTAQRARPPSKDATRNGASTHEAQARPSAETVVAFSFSQYRGRNLEGCHRAMRHTDLWQELGLIQASARVSRSRLV